MRGKSVALLVLALGCGLVAALGITQVLSHSNTQPVAVETVPVMAAASDIPAYAVITNEMIKTEEWPKDRVPPGALTRTEDVVGRCAKWRIGGGDLLTNPKLLARGEIPTNNSIPKGLRVVTVPVDISMIAGGLVIPTSRVDVQLYVRKGQDPMVSETMTKTILQDIRVFAVNDITNLESPDKKEQTKSLPGGRTVSLLVTPQQGGIVTAASELGTLRLILRNADDNGQPVISPVMTRDVLSNNDGMKRDKENANDADKNDGFENLFKKLQERLAAQKARGPSQLIKPESRWSMRLVNASEVSDVMLKTNDTSAQAIWTVQGLPEHLRPLPPPSLAPAASGGPMPGTVSPQGQPAAGGQPSTGGKTEFMQRGTVPSN